MRKSFSLLLFITLLNILYHLFFFSYDKEIENTLIVIKRGMKISEISDMLHNKELLIMNLHLKFGLELNFLEKKNKVWRI